MRKLVLALLMASVATPAVAQSATEQRRAAREQARAEKTERAQARVERRRGHAEQPAQVREPSLVPVDEQARRPAVSRATDRGRASSVVQPRPRLAQPGRENRDSVATWRREQRAQQRGSLAETLSDRIDRRRATPPADARPDRPAPPPQTASRRGSAPRWTSSWHNDRRYNWRDHRRRHRSLFQLGFYFDPFGWNYRRYNRGWRLWPSYYDSSYWLRDPFMYRLPYAPHPYRWVRYWDDALLVDVYTGQVVDVVHDFFW
jgi:Ni/Co efflux regulator RcnB